MAHTVMVTGADGFIGSHLTEELVKKGEKVKAFCYYNSFNSCGWIDPLFFQLPAQKLGALVVVGEYALFDFQNPHFVHRYLSLVCLIAWLYQSSSIV